MKREAASSDDEVLYLRKVKAMKVPFEFRTVSANVTLLRALRPDVGMRV